MQQLGLPLSLPIVQEFSNFILARNAEPVAAVQDWAEGRGAPYLALHGEAGCGKTHLLQAASRCLGERHQPARVLSLADASLTPDSATGLDDEGAVLLDDLDAVAGDDAWEQAVFALFNRVRERGGRLLVTAARPPAALAFKLPDLQSRLCSGPGFLLQPLDETGLDQLLEQGARERGFPLDPAARRYLLSRCTRDPARLMALLDDVDAASLAQSRAPTVPFLSAFLAGRAQCG